MLHCDLRVRWKLASDLQFRAAISEPKILFFCGISGDLAPSTRKSLAIATVRFWGAKGFPHIAPERAALSCDPPPLDPTLTPPPPKDNLAIPPKEGGIARYLAIPRKRRCDRYSDTLQRDRGGSQCWVTKPTKKGLFDKNGEIDEFAFYPLTQTLPSSDPRKRRK